MTIEEWAKKNGVTTQMPAQTPSIEEWAQAATGASGAKPAQATQQSTVQPVFSGTFPTQKDQYLMSDINSAQDWFTQSKGALSNLQTQIDAASKAWQQAETAYRTAAQAGRDEVLIEQAYSQYSKAVDDYNALLQQYQSAQSVYNKNTGFYNTMLDSIATSEDSYRKQASDLLMQAGELRRQANAATHVANLEPDDLHPFTTVADYTANTAKAAELNKQAEEMEKQAQALLEAAELSRGVQYQQRYGEYTDSKDFAEKSKYTEEKTDKKVGFLNPNPLSQWEFPLYEAINGNEEARKALHMDDVNGAGESWAYTWYKELTGGQKESYHLTENEKNTFNYIYHTQGREAAQEYYDFIKSDLNARRRASEAEANALYAKQYPVLASLESVLVNKLASTSYLEQAVDLIADGKLEANAAYNAPVQYVKDVRNTVSEDWGPVGSFAYQTGMSMADFLSDMLLVGGPAANSNAAVAKAGKAISLAMMGTRAAADSVVSAKERGASDGWAFALGTIAGLAEVVSETYSIDALLDADLLRESIGKYILKNAAAEGSEEAFSDFINWTADAIYETITHTGKSEWASMIQGIMAENPGLTEEQAFAKAVGMRAQELGMDALGGALSGALMGSGTAGVSVIRSAVIGGQIEKAGQTENLIQEGLKLDHSSEAYIFAKELSGQSNWSPEQVGKLYLMVSEQARTEAEPRTTEATKKSAKNTETKTTVAPEATTTEKPATVDTVEPVSYNGKTMQDATDAYTAATRMLPKTAKQKAAIIQKVWQGAPLTQVEVRSLQLSNTKMRAVFNVLTGLELDESVNKMLASSDGTKQVAQLIQEQVQEQQAKRTLAEAEEKAAQNAPELREAALGAGKAAASVMASELAGKGAAVATRNTDLTQEQAQDILTNQRARMRFGDQEADLTFDELTTLWDMAAEQQGVPRPSDAQLREEFIGEFLKQNPNYIGGGNQNGGQTAASGVAPAAGEDILNDELRGEDRQRPGEQAGGVPEAGRETAQESSGAQEVNQPADNTGNGTRDAEKALTQKAVRQRRKELRALDLKTETQQIAGADIPVLDAESTEKVLNSFPELRRLARRINAMHGKLVFTTKMIPTGTKDAQGRAGRANGMIEGMTIYLQVNSLARLAEQTGKHELSHFRYAWDLGYFDLVNNWWHTIHDSNVAFDNAIREHYDTETGDYHFLGAFEGDANLSAYYQEFIADLEAGINRLGDAVSPEAFQAMRESFLADVADLAFGGQSGQTGSTQFSVAGLNNSGNEDYNEDVNANTYNGGTANGREETRGAQLDRDAGARVQERQGVLAGGRSIPGGRTLGQGNLSNSGVVRVSNESRKILQSRGVPINSIEQTDDAAKYSAMLDEARKSDPVNGWAVTPQTPEDLQGKRLFLSKNGTFGAAITADGDIEAVFRDKSKPSRGRVLQSTLPLLIEQGGRKLDCYGDVLARVYARAGGLRPVCRVEFNPEYANDGWTPDKGTPYIYFMAATDTVADTIIKNQESYPTFTEEELNQLPTFDKDEYDKAYAYRDRVLAEQNKPKFSVSSENEELFSDYQNTLEAAVSFMKDAGFEIDNYYQNQLDAAVDDPNIDPYDLLQEIYDNSYHPKLTQEQEDQIVSYMGTLDKLTKQLKTPSDIVDPKTKYEQVVDDVVYELNNMGITVGGNQLKLMPSKLDFVSPDGYESYFRGVIADCCAESGWPVAPNKKLFTELPKKLADAASALKKAEAEPTPSGNVLSSFLDQAYAKYNGEESATAKAYQDVLAHALELLDKAGAYVPNYMKADAKTATPKDGMAYELTLAAETIEGNGALSEEEEGHLFSFLDELDEMEDESDADEDFDETQYAPDPFDPHADSPMSAPVEEPLVRTPTDINTPEFKRWFHDNTGELSDDSGKPYVFWTGAKNAGYASLMGSEGKPSPGEWFTRDVGVADFYASGGSSGAGTPFDYASGGKQYNQIREVPVYNASSWIEAYDYVDKYFTTYNRWTGVVGGLELRGMKNGNTASFENANSIQLRTNYVGQEEFKKNRKNEGTNTPVEYETDWHTLAEWPNTEEGLKRFNREFNDLVRDAYAGPRGYAANYLSMGNGVVVDAHGVYFDAIPRRYVPEDLRTPSTREAGHAHNRSGGSTVHINDLAARAREAGYDGLVVKNVDDAGGIQDQYIVFDNRNVKSVYNEGTWNPADENRKFSVSDSREEAIAAFDAEHGEGSAQAIINAIAAQVQQYGRMPQASDAAREVSLPQRTEANNRVSATAETVAASKATPENRVLTIEEAVKDGKMSYVPIENKVTARKAERKLQINGWAESVRAWREAVDAGRTGADLVAMGATLLNNAGNSEATAEEYLNLLADYSQLLRRAGQAVQAANILKRMTPEGRLYEVQKTVDKMNDKLLDKGKGFDPKTGEFNGIQIDPELVNAYREAKTDEERDVILDMMAQNVADQMISSGMDLWKAWRYLNMLGNFRTQVRNLLGNTGFQPVRMFKDSMVGLTEALLQKAGVNIERTSSMKRDASTWRAAKDIYLEYQDAILSGGKYQDDLGTNFAGMVNDKRRIFDHTKHQMFNRTAGKVLEAYRQGTNWAMDQGDAIFCQFTFRDSLARFMAANHTTWDEASPELRTRAVNKAVHDAAEATYRDNNALSTWISKAARSENTPKLVKAITEGVMPFRKTPANILMRAYEYSPLSIVQNTVQTIQTATGKENVTGNQIVEQWAKTFTGTGLAVLGYALAAMGKLVGKAPDDEKEKALFDQQGKQAYSLVAGGHTYTLDWLAPEAIPLFLGANIAQAAMEGGLTLKEGLDAVMKIGDPILEMSMLQGVNDALENASSYGNDSALVSFIANAAWSYLTQGLTNTLVGQLERGLQGNQRMQTYVDKNADVPATLQRTIGKTSAKIPGWDYNQIPYIDAWGDPQQNADSETWNVITQLFSPSYVSKEVQNESLKEITRLYDATDDTGVILSTAPKYFMLDGQKKDLTADEYLTYAITRGQAAKAAVAGMMNDSLYQGLDDAAKAKAISTVYDYANQIAKAQVSDFKPDSWVTKAQEAEEKYGIPVEEYILLRQAAGNIESTKDKSGETIAKSKDTKIMDMLYRTPGLTTAQVKAMGGYLCQSANVANYSRQEVQTGLAETNAKASGQAGTTAVEQSPRAQTLTTSVQQSDLWAGATTAQQESVQKQIDSLVKGDYYGKKAQAKIDEGSQYGLDETEYMLFKLSLQMSDTNGNGSYTNSEVEAAIRAIPGLSDAERNYLWVSQGKSPRSTPVW